MAREKLEVSAVVWLGGKNFDASKIKENNGSITYRSVKDWIERNKSYWSVCDGLFISVVDSENEKKAHLWLMNKSCKTPYDLTDNDKLVSLWFDKKFDLGKGITYLNYDENLLVTCADKYVAKMEG